MVNDESYDGIERIQSTCESLLHQMWTIYGSFVVTLNEFLRRGEMMKSGELEGDQNTR